MASLVSGQCSASSVQFEQCLREYFESLNNQPQAPFRLFVIMISIELLKPLSEVLEGKRVKTMASVFRNITKTKLFFRNHIFKRCLASITNCVVSLVCTMACATSETSDSV